MSDALPNELQSVGLGSYLANIRRARGYSLRHVETLTNKAVSNAYLSQIESGKVAQPSPNILHALSEVYKVSYEQLMGMAGFISNRQADGTGHGQVATFVDMELTATEADELLQYLHFRREQAKKRAKNEGG